MKPRIQPYISPENFHWLKAMAKRPGLSESTIIDGAVTAYRAGESDNKREAAINRRLDRLTRNPATHHAAIGFDTALDELLDAPEMVQHYADEEGDRAA